MEYTTNHHTVGDYDPDRTAFNIRQRIVNYRNNLIETFDQMDKNHSDRRRISDEINRVTDYLHNNNAI